MRRRKRPLVNWLPVPGVQPNQGNPDIKVNGFTFSIAIINTDAVNGLNTALSPITLDFPGEQRFQAAVAAGVLPSLQDYVKGSAYRLRRIVGKCFAGMNRTPPVDPNTQPPACIFGAGFIVLKVDPSTGVPLEPDLNEYSPLQAVNVSDPWIWRRTWLLGKNDAFGDGSLTDRTFSDFEPNNSNYGGGVADGPHIDQKTARIVGADERLFFVISTHKVPLLTDYTEEGLVVGYLDYRLLGSLINKSSTNRGNSSR